MTKLTKIELKEPVEQNEYEIKLVQYYEQIDSYKNFDDITKNTEIPGTQPTMSVPGYKALMQLYRASHDGDHKELENFSDSLEKISTYLFNDNHDKFIEQVFNDLERRINLLYFIIILIIRMQIL